MTFGEIQFRAPFSEGIRSQCKLEALFGVNQAVVEVSRQGAHVLKHYFVLGLT